MAQAPARAMGARRASPAGRLRRVHRSGIIQRRIARGVALMLVAMALALKIATPPGLMVRDDLGPLFEICQAQAPAFGRQDAGSRHEGQDHDRAGSQDCAFAAAAQVGPAPAPAHFHAVAFADVRAGEGGPASIASPGHGLAAPPPPSRGPPAAADLA